MNLLKLIRPLIGPLLFFIILLLPLELESSAHRFLGIFTMTVYLWLEGKVPLFVTGLLGVSLSVLMGVENASTALASFANPIIFLFLAGFLYAKAMENIGLDRRLSLTILSMPSIRKSFNRLILVLFFLTAFLSMWVSNTATTAMMLPIVLGILSSLGIKDQRTKVAMLLGVAYSASIGGLGSPVGSPPNIIAIGLLRELKGIEIAFYQWLIYGIPFVIIFIFILFYFIKHMLDVDAKVDKDFIQTELNKLGKVKFKEQVLVLLFTLLVAAWFLPGILHAVFNNDFTGSIKATFNTGIVGAFFACLLFIIPFKNDTTILDAHDFKSIDWGALFLFGAGLSLGKILFATGLADLAGKIVIENILGSGLFFMLIVLCYFTIFSTELASNTASANILIPIIIAACGELGINARYPIVAIALCCSLAFMLPVGTPPNAIVYGTGEVEVKDMIKLGIKLNLIFGFIVALAFYLFI